jgi:tetratricopeptide (TPR) repeat protein
MVWGFNETGYHIVNLSIHIINALLVYVFILLTFKSPHLARLRLNRYSGKIAIFSALIFVTHPIHTQAVTYISQRFTSLATLFYLLSVVSYAVFRLGSSKSSRSALFAVSLISAVIAMFTKEISFTLPLAIALWGFVFMKGRTKKRLLILLPLLLTMLIIPVSLIDMDNSMTEAIGDATKTQEVISRHDYLLTQFRVMVTYLRLLVAPVSQNLDYDYPVYQWFFTPEIMLSFAFVAGLIAFGIHLLYYAKTEMTELRLAGFGVIWFFLTISVESSFISLADVINEHRLYLPSIGAFVAFAAGTFMFISRINSTALRKGIIPFLIILPIVLASVSYARNTVWRGTITLWEDIVSKSPNKARTHLNLGLEYFNKGLVNRAEEQYKIALKLRPNDALAYNNLGTTYFKKEQFDEAIDCYKEAVKLDSDFSKAHNNLGAALSSKGFVDKAIGAFNDSLKSWPDNPVAHNNLGLAYMKKGMHEKAIMHFKTAVRLDPAYVNARNNLERAYRTKSMLEPSAMNGTLSLASLYRLEFFQRPYIVL